MTKEEWIDEVVLLVRAEAALGYPKVVDPLSPNTLRAYRHGRTLATGQTRCAAYADRLDQWHRAGLSPTEVANRVFVLERNRASSDYEVFLGIAWHIYHFGKEIYS